MDASILDLRYKMRDVLKALDRRQKVRILYHGRIKGEIFPYRKGNRSKSCEHPMFGMLKGRKGNPSEIVSRMRRSRTDAL
jgi:hypothetical protein